MGCKGIGGHTKPNCGEEVSWLTPPEILNQLGEFDLDPCCASDMPWKTAKRMIHYPQDGLAEVWKGRVWLNPPYGVKETWVWMDKLARHGNGVAIIFARTETEGFFDTVWNKADGLLFIKKRLYFHHISGDKAKGNSGGPSVLVAYGKENANVLKNCGISGAFVYQWKI